METEDSPYFHGKVSRVEAEVLLKDGPDGKFLTRVSSSSHGDYVLSMYHSGSYMHFQIKSQGECWFSIDDGPMFEGMEAIVRYYSAHPDGLPCVLTRPTLRPHKKKNESDGNGNLHNAALKGSVSSVKSYLKSSEISKVNKMRRTALHEAARANQPNCAQEIVAYMKSNGCDINAVDENGMTALHIASLIGADAVVRCLVTAGCNPGTRSAVGETARDIAARRGVVEACKVLGHAEGGITTESFLTELDAPWLHGRVSRTVAEHILSTHGQMDGLFLVRESTSAQGDFVLSMSYGGQNMHFQVQTHSKGYFIDDGPVFDCLSKVVEYYRSSADGLPCPLRVFCRRSSISKNSFLPGQFSTPSQPVRPVAPGRAASSGTSTSTRQGQGRLDSMARPRNSSSSDSKGNPADFDYNQLEPGKGRAEMPLMIRLEDLVLGKELGSGEFGEVFRGTWQRPGGAPLDVAVKTLREEAVGRSDEFLREANLMLKLKHVHVVNLLGVCLSQPLMIVQELVPLGALVDYLPKNRSSLRNDDLTLFAQQINVGMSFLEEQRFVHRDLATRNILVAAPNLVKISDFGLSRSIGSEDNYYKASAGGKWPIKWYAPESVYFGKFTSKSDVWSYGVTLWEIWTFGDLPYDDLTGREVLELIDQGGRLKQPPGCPNRIYEIMKLCWTYEAENRPTFAELYERTKTLRQMIG